jgi:predicted ABC-type ATPase
MTTKPVFWLIAGPDGVGKTTYARAHLATAAGTVDFVNLDEIARGLSPLAPERGRVASGRIAIARLREFFAARTTCATETTLSGAAQKNLIAEAKAAGFAVGILYFAVRAPETCIVRVARRVAEGGHDVPEADLRRRFARSLDNLSDYLALADIWRIFDADIGRPRIVAEKHARGIEIVDPTSFGALPAPISTIA